MENDSKYFLQFFWLSSFNFPFSLLLKFNEKFTQFSFVFKRLFVAIFPACLWALRPNHAPHLLYESIDLIVFQI